MNRINNTILFLLKVPPPIHGSTLMNRVVAESDIIASDYNKAILTQSISESVSDIGKISIRKVAKVFKNYYNLIKILRSDNIDLVYFALSPTGKAFIKDFLAISIIKLFGIKLVYHFHSKGVKDQQNWLLNLFYKISFEDQYCIVLSERLINDVSDYNFKKIFTLANGIKDYSNNLSVNKNEKFVITLIANYIYDKGIYEYLNVIRCLSDRGCEFEFDLIGQPKEISIDDIQKFIDEHNLQKRLRHIGPLYGDEKFKALLSSSLFIYPSKNDCYPLVLLEAMQCSLPVISSFEGGIPDIVQNEVNGFLVESTRIEEMVDKTISIIEDDPKRLGFSYKSRHIYEQNNTIEVFEKNLNSILNQILLKHEK